MIPTGIIEQRIAEAIASGDMAAPVQGSGMPLNLDSYFAVHEDDRMAYAMLRSSGHVPPEVDWLREMGELRAALALATDSAKRADLQRQLALLETAWQMRVERAKKR